MFFMYYIRIIYFLSKYYRLYVCFIACSFILVYTCLLFLWNHFYCGQWLDMLSRLFEITDAWEQGFVWMERLESKAFLIFWPLGCLLCHFLWIFWYLMLRNLTCYRYKWMTYGEAGTSRSAIGSGLVYHGIRRVS